MHFQPAYMSLYTTVRSSFDWRQITVALINSMRDSFATDDIIIIMNNSRATIIEAIYRR